MGSSYSKTIKRIRNNTITFVDLSQKLLQPQDVEMIYELMAINTSVTSLCIGSIETRQQLPASPQKNFTLQELRLVGTNFNAQLLVYGLMANFPCITNLTLDDNNLTTEDIYILSGALSGLESLKIINNCLMGDYGIEALLQQIKLNQYDEATGLTELWLENCFVTDAHSRILSTCTSLQYVNLSKNFISDDGAFMLALLLLTNDASLKYLNLSCNQITDVGAKAFENAISTSNATLIWLDLTENDGISSEVMTEIKKCVNENIENPDEKRERILQQSNTNSNNPSEFYTLFAQLMQDNTDLIESFSKLCNVISNVHEMKIYYTLVSISHRNRLVDQRLFSNYIKMGLERTSLIVKSSMDVAIFRTILRKAMRDDDLISQLEFDKYDIEAIANRVLSDIRFLSLQQAVADNTRNIIGLEGNIHAVNHSLQQLRSGLRTERRAKSAMVFCSVVLNAISFGVFSSILDALVGNVIGQIVDFGDAAHIMSIASSIGEIESTSILGRDATLVFAGTTSDTKNSAARSKFVKKAIDASNEYEKLLTSLDNNNTYLNEEELDKSSVTLSILIASARIAARNPQDDTDDNNSSQVQAEAALLTEKQNLKQSQLHEAIRNGDLEQVMTLVCEGSCNLDATDSTGNALFELAINEQQWEILNFLHDCKRSLVSQQTHELSKGKTMI